MIITEKYAENLTRTYSDTGMKIERDGVLYDEAIDPDWAGRTYTETTEPVENVEHISKEQEYLKCLQMLGVDVSGA